MVKDTTQQCDIQLARAFWQKQIKSNTNTYVKAVKLDNKETNAFIKFPTFMDKPQEDSSQVKTNTDNKLFGIPFAIKDNIALKNEQLTCASRLLEDFVSPITATAVKHLLQDGAVPVARTNMDEFGMGLATSYSIYGRTNNPWDLKRTAGGSSGGSVSAVASGYVPFALGSDTGGSVRQPAAFCGIWGLKPTYGAVSRYGLVAYSSSLDSIGIVAEHWKWLKIVFDSIKNKKKDIHDVSTFVPSPQKMPSSQVKKIALCIPKGTSSKIEKAMRHAGEEYKKAGYKISFIDLPFLEYSSAVYLTLSTAEASTNLARFDGIRYGKRGAFAKDRIELIRNARSQGLGTEVKLRVLLGGFVLRSGFQDQYYVKAQQLQNYIKQEIIKIFTQADIIVLPVFPTAAFCFGKNEVTEFKQKLGDACTVLANLTGIPAVCTPISFEDNLPAAIQLLAPHYAEERLFTFLDDTAPLFEHKRCLRAQNFLKSIGREI